MFLYFSVFVFLYWKYTFRLCYRTPAPIGLAQWFQYHSASVVCPRKYNIMMEGFTTINFLKDTLFNIPQIFYIFLDLLMDFKLFSLWGTSWRFWTLLKWREGCQYWNGEGIGRGCQNLITMSDCWDYNDYIVGLLSPLSFHCMPWPLCCREIGARTCKPKVPQFVFVLV